jgi:hypothetical protein
MTGGLVSLGMIGGFLHLKTPEIVSEYLPIAKMLDGGPKLDSVMKLVMQAGGLQGIMTNPLGAISGQLQGTIAQGLSSLSGIPGVGGLVSSLSGSGGLISAATNLTSTASSLLSGQGVLGVLSHTGIVSLAGSAIPDALSLDRVLAPVFSDGLMSYVDTAVGQTVSDVVSGVTSVSDAVSLVDHFASSAQGVADAATYALNTVAGFDVLGSVSSLAADISSVHAVASVVATAMNPDAASAAPQLLAEALMRSLPVDVINTMLDSVAQHVYVPDPQET